METVQSIKQYDYTNNAGEYVLATGQAAANRLRILHDVYGPGARRVLLDGG